MARSTSRGLSSSVRSEFGDRVGANARLTQPLVLGERNSDNAKAYDAIKGNEESFQKLITIMARWQDGVGNTTKIAFKDAYDELPQKIKDLITEPRETMEKLKRGINEPKSEIIKRIKDGYERSYERILNKYEYAEDYEPKIEKLEKEEKERLRVFNEASSINGWTHSIETALKFGNYVLTSDEVESFDAIVSTAKLEKIMKSVFTPESISQDYVGGIHRQWARYENEYIVMGVKLSRDAEDLALNFINKNADMLNKIKESERKKYGE